MSACCHAAEISETMTDEYARIAGEYHDMLPIANRHDEYPADNIESPMKMRRLARQLSKDLSEGSQ